MSNTDILKISREKYPTCTLDIDCGDVSNLIRIIRKIRSCAFNLKVQTHPSSQKGFHCLVYCVYESCDMCRMVFDDPTRFAYDQFRSKESQNVLFTEKTYYGKKK